MHRITYILGLTFLLLQFLYCLYPSIAQAQEAMEDLRVKYEQTKKGTPERYAITGRYAQSLLFQNRSDESVAILKENIRDATAQKNEQYAAYLAAVLAIQYRILDDGPQSLSYLRLAQLHSAKTSDQEIRGYVNYTEGWLNIRNDKEADAVRNFQQAVDAYELAPKTEQLIGRQNAVYKELAAIYLNWNEIALYNKYVNLTLESAKRQKDPMRLFDAYMLMGYTHERQFKDNLFDTTARDQAEHFYRLAVKTYQDNKNRMVVPSDLAYASVNLANLYLESPTEDAKTKAQEYALYALEIAKETKQHNLTASSYGILSEIALKENNRNQAKNHLFAALSAMGSETMSDNMTTMTIFQRLSEIFEAEGNYQEAVHYYKQYLKAFESVYNTEKVEQSKRLEAQFDKERQDQKLIRMQLEAEKNEQQISLMKALAGQQDQELQNLKLLEENQKQQLEVVQLEAERRSQELQLSRLEAKQHAQDLFNSQKELNYKSRLNTVYFLLTAAFFLSILLLLYAYRQRSQTLKQQGELHTLEMEQEKKNSRISNLTAMLQGQENERARLARDLHDGLGGMLSSTKMNLSIASEKNGTHLDTQVKNSIGQLDMAVNELRRVAHNLMPELLVKYGLEEALKEYAVRMSNDKLDVSAQLVNVKTNLDFERQILVYRIIQELVNNAVKHAQASQIIIQISEDNGRILVTVEDNGKGFDKDKLDSKKTAGMHNIVSRLDFLKGEMRVDSEINLGTTIEFDFPATKDIS